MTSATSSAGRLSAPSPATEPPRSLTTTLAPSLASRSASPRPTPCPAPVTIATPPTWRFAMAHWGAFADEQPADPTKGRNPVMEIIGGLMQKGGLVLHGEQEFEYHRPLVVGDVLDGEGKVTDVYEKESKGK